MEDRFAKCEIRMDKVSAHDFRSDFGRLCGCLITAGMRTNWAKHISSRPVYAIRKRLFEFMGESTLCLVQIDGRTEMIRVIIT